MEQSYSLMQDVTCSSWVVVVSCRQIRKVAAHIAHPEPEAAPYGELISDALRFLFKNTIKKAEDFINHLRLMVEGGY